MLNICFDNIHLNALNAKIYNLNMSMKLRSIFLNKTIEDGFLSAKVIISRALFCKTTRSQTILLYVLPQISQQYSRWG